MEDMMEFREVECGVQVRAAIERQGADVLVQLVGGDVPHYGVVVTVDRAGEARGIALPSRPGHVHQESAIAEPLARRLHAALLAPGNVMVVSGVHVNAITPEQMRAVFRMCERLGERMADWLERHPVDAPEEVFASFSDGASK